MAVTLNKLIRDVQIEASSGPVSDDFRISDRLVENWITQVRADLISQALEKRKDISDTWIQEIHELELEAVDLAESCDIEFGCNILRSVRQLPNTIETKDSNLIIGVTGLDNTPITQTNNFKRRYKKYSRYTGQNKGWFLKDNYLYIMNDQLLKYVNVFGIFDDPRELASFNTCDDIPCFSWDSNYPVSAKMAKSIVDIIIQTKVKALMTFPQDLSNDSMNKDNNVVKE